MKISCTQIMRVSTLLTLLPCSFVSPRFNGSLSSPQIVYILFLYHINLFLTLTSLETLFIACTFSFFYFTCLCMYITYRVAGRPYGSSMFNILETTVLIAFIKAALDVIPLTNLSPFFPLQHHQYLQQLVFFLIPIQTEIR